MSTSNLPASNTPLFGRKYELIVTPSDGSRPVTITSSAWEPEALRFCAEISQDMNVVWQAFISVYNAEALRIFPIGSEITLSAGYQAGGRYGVVFNGLIIRTMIDRPNGTDWIVTFQCMVGYDLLVNNFVNYAYGVGQTQQQIIEQMCASARTSFKINGGNLLSQSQLPRGGTKFGSPLAYLQKVARDNNLYFCLADDSSVGFAQMTTVSTNAPQVYSCPIPQGSSMQGKPGVSYSIVGTPVQNSNGLSVRVLCDSSLKVLAPGTMTIKIDNTVIRSAPASFGTDGGTPSTTYPLLTADGVYAVVGLRHILDSRGNDWYTEAFCVVTGDQQLNMALGTDLDANDADINSLLPGVQ